MYGKRKYRSEGNNTGTGRCTEWDHGFATEVIGFDESIHISEVDYVVEGPHDPLPEPEALMAALRRIAEGTAR